MRLALPETLDKPCRTPSKICFAPPRRSTSSTPPSSAWSPTGGGALALREKVGATDDLVHNDVAFGHIEADDLPASRVLADGYGQCNTKGTLLMGLLRAAGVPCRFHGFTIDKALQKGALTGMAYRLAPRQIIHSWVEVWFESGLVCLEGFMLDADYLRSSQRRFPEAKRFCGFGVATPDLSAPAVEWCGVDTFIQREGIVGDFGTFDDPEAFLFPPWRQSQQAQALAVRPCRATADECDRGAHPSRSMVTSVTAGHGPAPARPTL
jgi:hypothetical protein